MNVLFAIPARGGSKRLKRKNILKLAGKPVIYYTINAAKKAGLAENIFVCTEDDEIAEISYAYGASIYKIPSEMADDEVSSTVPCLALLDHLESGGKNFDYIFNLQPTSPLRNAEDIKSSLNSLIETGFDYMLSTTFIDPHYFHWALAKKDTGWEMYFGKEFLKERTLLFSVYRPNGAIKLAKVNSIKDTKNFFGHPMAVYEMPEERSIHIATEFDFVCAEAQIINNMR